MVGGGAQNSSSGIVPEPFVIVEIEPFSIPFTTTLYCN